MKKSGSKYKVYRKAYKYACLKKGLKARSYQFRGEYSTKYRFAVRAFNGSKAGSFSPAKAVTTGAKSSVTTGAESAAATEAESTSPTPAAKPGKVTGLKATSATDSTVNITWDKLSGSVTGYEIRVNGAYYREVGLGRNTLTISGLTSETEYDITVTAYYTGNRQTYGTPAQITVVTKEAGCGGETVDPGNQDDPVNDHPSGPITYKFDYHSIPFAMGSAIIGDPGEQGSVDIGNGQHIDRGVRKKLLPIVNAWMAENLPADATDAEKANLCVKAVYELKNTPESIAVMGNPNGKYPDDPSGWKGNSECIRYADYFDTCAYAAGLISASRLCNKDEDYDVPFGRNHVTNFVWIDGVGYVTELSTSRRSHPTLSVINFDWNELHIVPTNTTFNCRYY